MLFFTGGLNWPSFWRLAHRRRVRAQGTVIQVLAASELVISRRRRATAGMPRKTRGLISCGNLSRRG